MSRNKIGGWTRIWIVISGLWVVIVTVTAIAIAPDFSGPTEVYHGGEWIPLDDRARRAIVPGQTLADAEVKALASRNQLREEDYEAPPETDVESVVRYSGAAFGIAVVPPLLLYVFGWSVGWIRRGFQG